MIFAAKGFRDTRPYFRIRFLGQNQIANENIIFIRHFRIAATTGLRLNFLFRFRPICHFFRENQAIGAVSVDLAIHAYRGLFPLKNNELFCCCHGLRDNA